MYHYIYHQELRKQKYNKLTLTIEGMLHKLGLSGRIIKLGPYTSLTESLKQLSSEDAVSHLVVVGDDELFSLVINDLHQFSTQPILGYLPVFSETNITRCLGLPPHEEAILVLAKRRIESVNLAYAGDVFFLDSAVITHQGFSLELDGSFSVSTSSVSPSIRVCNFPFVDYKKELRDKISPKDMTLDVVVHKTKTSLFGRLNESLEIESFFQSKKIRITSNEVSSVFLVDGFRKLKTPLELGVSDHSISIITGRDCLIR